MKHLTIIVPDGQSDLNSVSCIIGAYEIFTRANTYREEQGKKKLFTIELAGVTPEADFHHGLLTLKPQSDISNISKTNLIIIPSLERDCSKITKGNQLLAEWIVQQYKNGAEVASMCTGAFMLAATGLLDGRNCSTHWYAADSFRHLFPQVHLQTEKLITDENGIYTNGGGYSFLNLAIYLVEKYYDRQTAIYCSKLFQVEIDRQTQSTFTIFTGQKTHGDEVVRKAQTYIEDNLQEKISVEQLASLFATGRRNFDRRFIRATGNTPAEYLQRVKVESAKKTFETTRKTVNEVMYEVGYSDVKAFREVFRKITGISPLEYRNRYNREALV
ncbi:helix-turn-helix domain-containing protein [Chitinophaga sp. Mgbs1]|uniref:Helix-turn-helix domain-containing protein n=1 Tax=Chitinophaga solisilvae TaxID=1233460 RepID=A0A433WCR1_9BACT|nr:helix-turn-helix domain-containing protein [Chitinophaga solisilvae]